ncbi:MAG: hypothetical protein ACKOWP_00120 [Microbacteriaceae bacterium]
MRRSLFAWGIVVCALLAIAAATVWVLNASTYSAHATVERYLTALAEGRTSDAARLAGVDPESVAPVPTDPGLRITGPFVAGGVAHDGVVTVEARATLRGADVLFRADMIPAPALGGIFTQWEFAEHPTGSAHIDATPVKRVLLNGSLVDTSNPVAVLAPGIVSVASASSWFDAPEQVVVVEAGSTPQIAVALRPSAIFRSIVDDSLADYLDDCAAQHVMFPIQCPFGASTDNTIHDGPRWVIHEYPEAQYSRTAQDLADGAWTVRGTGIVDLEATLVDNASGTLFPVDSRQQFTIVARITGLDTDNPRVTVINPSAD